MQREARMNGSASMRSWTCVALCCAPFVATPAAARSVTVYFTGEVASVVDMASDTTVPAAVGTPFSGYLTYDVEDAEDAQSLLNTIGQPIAYARADAGCLRTLNTVCQDDRGTNAPVVVDYRFKWGVVTFAPLADALGFFDGSERYNQSVGGSPSGEAWLASRNQQRTDTTGDPNGAYQQILTQRAISIGVNTSFRVPRLLKKPASNLEQGFNLDVVSAEQQNFTFRSGVARINCTAPNFCPEQFDVGSFQLIGKLKSVTFNSGKSQK